MSAHVLSAPPVLIRVRERVEPALRTQVDRIADSSMRRIAAYQLGWCDAEGRPTDGHSGKAIRPALAVIGAEAAGFGATDNIEAAVTAAVAVELIHNFSLLHDDVMDGDLERRHRPTGWAAFQEGPALLAGNAMLLCALDAVLRKASADSSRNAQVLACLIDATQRLISGQSDDLRFEDAADVTLPQVLHMEVGKTASLLSCAASVGALAAGADAVKTGALADFGHHLGLAFQLVDDVLGICGDPQVTGKSASSDLRTGKRSAPVVAALTAGNDDARRLQELLADGPPVAEADVELAAALVAAAGGIDWALREADARLDAALRALENAPLQPGPSSELADIARYVVQRDR